MYDNEYTLTYNNGVLHLHLHFNDFPEGQIFNFNIKVPKRTVREVYFNIKAYPRPNRNTQQIYIDNKYFMSLPSRVYEAGFNRDVNNKLGQIFIELIKELYTRGVNLNNIRDFLEGLINKNVKRCFVSREAKEKQQINLLKNYHKRN